MEERYEGKPIFIKDEEGGNWYIINDASSQMPAHMLTAEDADLYDENEGNIDGIKLIGRDCEYCYVMWIYFNKDGGWTAYGYE